MPFDFGFKTETTQELLKIVEKINFKGYEQYFKKNPNGDYNHMQNFFIWKKKNKSEYIRITLLKSAQGFYWNLEKSFKPNCWKHNHKENANIKSDFFKSSDNERYLNYFKNIVGLIKE